MALVINPTDYSTLFQYGVIAAKTITNTHSTIINNGYWFSPTLVLSPPSSTFKIGKGLPSGYNEVNSAKALEQLTNLIEAIITYCINPETPSTDIVTGGADITFQPYKNYYGENINYTAGQTLTFDAGGNINAQFFITDIGSGMTFTDVNFVLIGGADPRNIFWLSDPTTGAGGFTVTNPRTDVPGIIITTNSASTFTINSQNINGRIYSNQYITIISSGSGVNINANPDPIVCYPKETLILTKHHFIPSENIKTVDKVVTKGKIYKNTSIDKVANIKIEPVMLMSKIKVNELNELNSKSRQQYIFKRTR